MISTALLRAWMPDLVLGALQTIEMAVLAYALGAAVGLVIALAEGAGVRWLYRVCRVYIEFIRGTPTLTQLFLIYFGLASVNIVIPGFEAAVIALGMHYAAYMAEIYRSGISSVDRGQHEAAQANSAISLLKDTSVASLIAAPELMMRANDITSEYYMPMQVYLITGAMYFVMAYPLSLGARRLERLTGTSRRIAIDLA
jgi:polar amino acid transport system permease protein